VGKTRNVLSKHIGIHVKYDLKARRIGERRGVLRRRAYCFSDIRNLTVVKWESSVVLNKFRCTSDGIPLAGFMHV
jgi:hypothetical protein